MTHPRCHRCDVEMVPGKALESTVVGHEDLGEVCTTHYGGPGRLVNCMKCEICGQSYYLGRKKDDIRN